MKDTVRIINYAWADRFVVSRDSQAAITIDVTDEATPGQLAAIMRRICDEKGWTP